MADLGISNPVNSCLRLFQRLLSADSPGTSNASNQSILSSLREEQARFKVWVGNIGAHKTGRSSLQYRLRDASHIQKQVVELIADLAGLVDDARAIIAGEKTPWDELEGDDESLLDEMGMEADSDDDEFPETELGQIATDVVDVINCLLRLSVAIRNPAPHDRFAASVPAMDIDHFEHYDIQHVQGKFSQVDKDLAKRLGKAISKRRQYFKYRESHHLKLSDGVLAEPSAPKDTVSTIASSIPEETKGPSFDPTRLAAMDEDAVSDSGVSQTSFASSIAEAETLKIPPLPKKAEKGPFECPFCFMMITATTTISWRRHVFGDLRPYICLSGECTESGREFSRRHEWTAHELQNHWKRYVCPGGCHKTFTSASQCRSHLDSAHSNSMPANQMDAMISLSARPMGPEDGINCPLCQEPLSSFRQYQRHVGRHQEQLALFSLPHLESQEDGDSDDGGTSQSDNRGSGSEAADLSVQADGETEAVEDGGADSKNDSELGDDWLERFPNLPDTETILFYARQRSIRLTIDEVAGIKDLFSNTPEAENRETRAKLKHLWPSAFIKRHLDIGVDPLFLYFCEQVETRNKNAPGTHGDREEDQLLTDDRGQHGAVPSEKDGEFDENSSHGAQRGGRLQPDPSLEPEPEYQSLPDIEVDGQEFSEGGGSRLGGNEVTDLKPRLTKDEVELLEREFLKNPKPSNSTKRELAGQVGVEVPRINNWFQNRRAKEKVMRRAAESEANQSQDIEYTSATDVRELPHLEHAGFEVDPPDEGETSGEKVEDSSEESNEQEPSTSQAEEPMPSVDLVHGAEQPIQLVPSDPTKKHPPLDFLTEVTEKDIEMLENHPKYRKVPRGLLPVFVSKLKNIAFERINWTGREPGGWIAVAYGEEAQLFRDDSVAVLRSFDETHERPEPKPEGLSTPPGDVDVTGETSLGEDTHERVKYARDLVDGVHSLLVDPSPEPELESQPLPDVEVHEQEVDEGEKSGLGEHNKTKDKPTGTEELKHSRLENLAKQPTATPGDGNSDEDMAGHLQANFTVEELSDFVDSGDERHNVIDPRAIEHANLDQNRSRSQDPPGIDPTVAHNSNKLAVESGSDESEVDEVEVKYREFLRERREQMRQRRMPSGSIGKRTIGGTIGSDADEENRGSSARRIHQRVGDMGTFDLKFSMVGPSPEPEPGYTPSGLSSRIASRASSAFSLGTDPFASFGLKGPPKSPGNPFEAALAPSAQPRQSPPGTELDGLRKKEVTGTATMVGEALPIPGRLTASEPSPRIKPQSRQPSSAMYNRGDYRTEVAVTKGRASRRASYYGHSPSGSYDDKLKQAGQYQDEILGVGGSGVQLTAEMLRNAARHGRKSSNSSRSSGSRDESDYKRSATTGTTRSSAPGEGDMTIRVKGNAVITVGGAEMRCQDGTEINISRTTPTAGFRTSSDQSSYLGQEDRRARIRRDIERLRPEPRSPVPHYPRETRPTDGAEINFLGGVATTEFRTSSDKSGYLRQEDRRARTRRDIEQLRLEPRPPVPHYTRETRPTLQYPTYPTTAPTASTNTTGEPISSNVTRSISPQASDEDGDDVYQTPESYFSGTLPQRRHGEPTPSPAPIIGDDSNKTESASLLPDRRIIGSVGVHVNPPPLPPPQPISNVSVTEAEGTGREDVGPVSDLTKTEIHTLREEAYRVGMADERDEIREEATHEVRGVIGNPQVTSTAEIEEFGIKKFHPQNPDEGAEVDRKDSLGESTGAEKRLVVVTEAQRKAEMQRSAEMESTPEDWLDIGAVSRFRNNNTL